VVGRAKGYGLEVADQFRFVLLEIIWPLGYYGERGGSQVLEGRRGEWCN